MGRILSALVGAVRIALRALDLDDIRPEIREHHSGTGSGDERSLLDDPDARQCGTRAHQPSSLASNPARQRAFVLDRLRGGVRHDETDAVLLFLEKVRDQAGGTRQNGNAFERGDRVPRIEQYGRNRARYI